jgi:hypothetical protein
MEIFQTPHISDAGVPPGTTLDSLCTALETAPGNEMNLSRHTLKSNAAALHQKSIMQLVCRKRGPGLTHEEMERLSRWGRGVAPVDRWTVSRDSLTISDGTIHLPPSSQLWLAAKNLCFNNVKFSGVMLCLSFHGTDRYMHWDTRNCILVFSSYCDGIRRQ